MRVGSCPVLVGRGAELEDLLRTLRRADGVRGVETVVIIGEAGVGKSRFVEEFRNRLTREICFVCHCAAAGSQVEPLAPLVQLLRAATVAGLGSAALDPARIVEDTIAVIDSIVRDRQVVIVIEDAHWADAGTASFISLLRSRHFLGSILLVLTERPSGPDESRWTGAADRLVDEPDRVQVVRLRGLDLAQTGDLLSKRWPERASTPLVSRIFRLAKGNPLLTEDLQDAATDVGDVIPISMREALRRKVSGLHRDARRMASLLAVAGRPLAAALIDRLFGMQGRSALGELVSCGLVVDAGGMFQFAHPLHLEILATLVPAREKAEIHRAIAEAMTAWTDPVETPQSIKVQLALHWHEGGTVEQAVTSAIAAAQAIERLAPRDALLLYVRAIERAWEMPHWPEGSVGPVELRRGAALAAFWAGEPDQGLAFIDEAISMWAPDDGPPLALLLEHRGRILDEQGDSAAKASYLDALAALESTTPNGVVAVVEAGAGLALVRGGQKEEGLRLLSEAAKLSSKLEDPYVISAIACDQAHADIVLGHAGSARLHADRCRSAGMKADSAHQVIAGYLVGARARYLETGDLGASIAMRAEGLEYALGHGQARTAGIALQLGLVEDHIETGDWERAQILLDELPPAVGGRLNVSDGNLARLFLAVRRGRPIRLAASLDVLVRSSDATYESYFLSLAIPIAHSERDLSMLRCLENRALELSDLADPAAAGRALYLVDALAAAIQGEAELESHPTRADRAAELLVRAEQLYAVGRALTPASREFTDGIIDVARGENLRTMGKAGREHWEAAVDHFRHAHVRFRLAYALFRLGEVLFVSGRAKRKACDAINEALTLSVDLGAVPLMREIEALAHRIGHGEGAAISPAELHIAKLVADGRRSSDVADELEVSIRTVDAAMLAVFRKLGIRSNAELAAWFRRGLGGR